VSDPFAAIRPYDDAEVRPTIDRLLKSRDFLNALLRLRLGDGALRFGWLLRPLARRYLRSQLAPVQGVMDLQMRVKGYIERMIEETTAGFSVSGLEKLDPNCAYVFISNHRDIAMDPAFTNYALHRAGYETLRIAIGDNLLTEQWVADLMRLNKSFIVQRSVSGPRELLAASKLLASYIRHSRAAGQRAGVDRAARGAGQGRPGSHGARGHQDAYSGARQARGEHGRVCCRPAHRAGLDQLRTRSLRCDESAGAQPARATGAYQKEDREDMNSIGRGISGNKGACTCISATRWVRISSRRRPSPRLSIRRSSAATACTADQPVGLPQAAR
jgi:hypothetical protein